MSLMVQPAERMMKDPSAKVVHKERKGSSIKVLCWKVLLRSKSGRWKRLDVVVMLLDTIMSSTRSGMEDNVSMVEDGIVVMDDADEDASATDHRHGCKRRKVPIGLSILERRA